MLKVWIAKMPAPDRRAENGIVPSSWWSYGRGVFIL